MTLVIIVSAFVFLLLIFKGGLDSISKKFLLSYAAVWFLALLLSTNGAAGLNIPDDNTVVLLIAHLFMFLFGFKTTKIKSCNTQAFTDTLRFSVDKFLDNKIFNYILIACLLYVLSMFAVFYKTVLVMQSLADVRTEFYEGDLYGSMYGLINTFILTPLDYVLFPLFGYMCIRRRNWQWGLAAIYLLVHSSLAGGRLGYIRIFLGIIFFVFCLSDISRHGKNRKNILIMAFASIAVYLLIIFTSAGRSGSVGFDMATLREGQEVANEHITSYTSGPIAAFDYALSNDYVQKVGGYKHGGLIFTTVEGLFYTLVGRLGITYERPITPVVEVLQNQPIDIGASNYWNALYTSCIYYYLDFGILGVIVLPFIIGLLFRYSIKRYYLDSNVYSFILVGYVFLKLIFSIIQFNFTNFSELLLVCMLVYMSEKKRNRVTI